MRTCAGFLRASSFIFGILGILAGALRYITPVYSVGTYGTLYSSTPDIGAALIIVTVSIGVWLTLYGFGSALDGIADIRDDTRMSLDANVRTAEALERWVAQERRETQATENLSPRVSVIKPIAR